MRAALFQSPGEPLLIDRVPDPEPGPRDLVLRVRACGICGSDLHLADLASETGGLRPLCRGAVMGHEFSGEVVDTGREIAGEWRRGERVTALPTLSCGRCAACLNGRPHRCAGLSLVGIGAVHGGYAEYVRVSAHDTLRLPDSVDDHHGALVEPLAVGLHAVHRARLERGDDILVIGAGPVGLAVALWSRFFGARNVVVSDFAADRRARALELGATACVDAQAGNVVGQFKEIAGGRPQVVFDCVGVPGSQQQAIDCAPADGRVVIVGLCMQPDRIVPVKAMTKELELLYAYCYVRKDFGFTIDMLAAGRIDPSPMLSGTVGFDAFAGTFERLKHVKSDCKVLLEPWRE
ncbi:MAG: hypothetical protein RIS35_2434 [Pseudomonadota bacterium]|jgi:(R,R)-butanediol dehydrogenase/meso-butanediol dehydrogenase/diacetyl reductase